MTGGSLSGVKSRLLQLMALHAPGGDTVRVALHRYRGVEIGRGTWIGVGTLIEPLSPHRVAIGDRVAIGIRVLILAHFVHQGRNREAADGQLDDRVSVRIDDDAFVGPGAMIMPNVTIGQGAVVAAGSVVTRSVAPLTMVQGNPAAPVARCTVPLGLDTPIKEFVRGLTPIESATNGG
jgi:acetyltransferase-like isoleucine patch superfamily enzyme